MRQLLSAIIALCLCCAGCTWRITPPTELDQALSIKVVADQGRIPRAAAYLQAAAAQAIAQQTGWTIHHDGPARLELSIDNDRFSVAADDQRSIPTRWNYRITITALLVTRHGTQVTTCTGTGSASSRATEADAVRDAARDAGDLLARWLAGISWTPARIP